MRTSFKKLPQLNHRWIHHPKDIVLLRISLEASGFEGSDLEIQSLYETWSMDENNLNWTPLTDWGTENFLTWVRDITEWC